MGAGAPGLAHRVLGDGREAPALGADMHGGGTDLLFPHHENELAQSRGAHPDHTFVRAWVHHGMVNFVGDKMASPSATWWTSRRPWSATAVTLSGCGPAEPLLAAHRLLRRDTGGEAPLYERLTRLYRQIAGSTDSSELSDRLAAELMERFDAAMRDDLNTPEAIAAVFEVAGRAGQEISTRPEAAREFSSLSEALWKS